MVSPSKDDAMRASVRPDSAGDVRARAWAFAFRCYESKKNPAAGLSVRGDSDGTKTTEDSADEPIIRD
jgi:hypothetical protein